MPRLLTQNDMALLLRMEEVIDAVEAGFRACAQDPPVIPVRLPLDMPDRRAVVLFMPAYLARPPVLGAKIVSVFPDNRTRGLPTVTGFYLLCDPETGALLALMDAAFLTGIRTAAASAVATRHLARRDSRVLGVFGAGVQARFHIEAMRTVLPIREIVVFNRTRAHAEAFVAAMSAAHPVPFRLADTPEACAAADVVVTCTAARSPLFDGRRLQPGAHVNAVGAYTPDMRELDAQAICRASVFVDTYEGAFAEAGDILIPLRQGLMAKEHVRAELAEVVSGRKAGRTSEEEITVFKSVGYALEDAVTARLAYEKAVRNGIGWEFTL
jgi:ornithine cyclodeaminase/alanine dehydrogenase